VEPVAPPEDAPRGLPLDRIGRWTGLALFGVLLVLPPPDGLTLAAWRTAAVGVLMGVWWMTEAIPLAATGLVPLVALPVLGVRPIAEASAPYANPIIFLFLGGFLVALAVERWGLHRRLALGVIRAVGTSPRRLVGGMLLATGLLSMWISNTATTLMLLPLALSLVRLADEAAPALRARFSTTLLLAVAYAASIGGMGTLIGTPPNAVFAGFMQETYGVRVSFIGWMGVGVPLVVVGLGVAYLVLTRLRGGLGTDELPGARALVDAERAALGPVSGPERRVGTVAAVTAAGWMTMPLLEGVVPGLTEAGLAVAAALVLFLIPAGDGTGARLLAWRTAERLPWDVLLLFGGGLSLAAAIEKTGLALWIGAGLEGLSSLPPFVVLLAVVLLIILLGEFTSNVATAAAFLPVVAPLAVALGQNPLFLAVPATLAASAGFILPAGTAPNAIAYGTGRVRLTWMMRAGFWLDLAFAVLVAVLAYALMGPALGVETGLIPSWAAPE
jgi:solute carrier family 13 (sodium-dependent dicarboxylate transporter), member 2/3/5